MAVNAEAVADALVLLGAAWRGDWSGFDGRTLRHQLDELSGLLRSEKAFDIDHWAWEHGICPKTRSWARDCTSNSTYDSCDHLRKIEARLFPSGDDE